MALPDLLTLVQRDLVLCRDGMRHEFRLGRNRSSRLTESPCKPHVHILPVERKTPDPFQDLQIATISLLLLWCSETIEAQQDGQSTTTSMTSTKWWIQRRRWDDEGPCTQRKTKVRRVQSLFFFYITRYAVKHDRIVALWHRPKDSVNVHIPSDHSSKSE